MGVFDTLVLPESPSGEEQVKLWNSSLRRFKVGDLVPINEGYGSTYAIACRSGGYAIIRDNILVDWTPEQPTNTPIYDKWGDVDTSKGLLGEDYLLE